MHKHLFQILEFCQKLDKNFYWWLTVEKILGFAVFNKEYLQSYGCVTNNFTAAVNCAYSKTEIHSGTIEMQNR